MARRARHERCLRWTIALGSGVPALTLGAGGMGRGAHSPTESFDTTGSATGTERALLAVLAAALDDR